MRTRNFFPGREHKSATFLKINPFGQLPAIDDEGYVLRDAQAILVYLTTRYGCTQLWFPANARARGRAARWLTVAEDITRSASAARCTTPSTWTRAAAPRTACLRTSRTIWPAEMFNQIVASTG